MLGFEVALELLCMRNLLFCSFFGVQVGVLFPAALTCGMVAATAGFIAIFIIVRITMELMKDSTSRHYDGLKIGHFSK